jgi:hypothetical protein
MKRATKGGNSASPKKVPIALFIHRRTWHLRRVLGAIRKYRPSRLFVYADGWEKGNSQQKRECHQARNLVQRAVNWPCQVSLHFCSRNQGLKTSVERGLSQVFAKVPEAIILEDDCVATPAFFKFCEDNLRKYRREPMVMSISGSCFVAESVPISGRAYFSKYPHCWGWATWRRAWRNYDGTLPMGVLREILERQRFPNAEREYWARVAAGLACGTMSSWAYFWLWAHWRHGGRALTPAVNLVTNIGFDPTARHTRELAKPLAIRRGDFRKALRGNILSCSESDLLDRSVFRNHYQAMAGRRKWWQKVFDKLLGQLPFIVSLG